MLDAASQTVTVCPRAPRRAAAAKPDIPAPITTIRLIECARPGCGRAICDFWSRILLGTERYAGSPYPVHTRLPVQPEHFERWLALFREAAVEFLPPASAEIAIGKAEMMANSFRAGLFTFTDRKA